MRSGGLPDPYRVLMTEVPLRGGSLVEPQPVTLYARSGALDHVEVVSRVEGAVVGQHERRRRVLERRHDQRRPAAPVRGQPDVAAGQVAVDADHADRPAGQDHRVAGTQPGVPGEPVGDPQAGAVEERTVEERNSGADAPAMPRIAVATTMAARERTRAAGRRAAGQRPPAAAPQWTVSGAPSRSSPSCIDRMRSA
jgi:hypothetical protein